MHRKITTRYKKQDHIKFYRRYWNDFLKLFEIIQKEVELEPIKPEEDKTPEGDEIKKEVKRN